MSLTLKKVWKSEKYVEPWLLFLMLLIGDRMLISQIN